MRGDAVPEINMVVGGFAPFPGPPPVVPGPHHQGVPGFGVVRFNGFVDVQRAVQVFCIEPAANRHDRVVDSPEVGQDVPFLPEFVIVRVLHDLLPEKIIEMEVLRYVFQRPLTQVKFIPVTGRFPGKPPDLVRVPGLAGAPFLLVPEHRKCSGITLQVGPLVVEVVEPEIGNRCLGGGGLQGRVRVGQGRSRIKPGVGDTVHAHPAIVVFNVVEHPFDGIVGIRTLVNGRGVVRVVSRDVRGHIVKGPVAHIPAPDILVSQDVAVPDQVVRRIAVHLVICIIGSVVAGPVKQNRIAPAAVLRRVNHRE